MRLFYTYFKIHILKQPCLRFADIAVGYRCNLSCIHCSSIKLNRKDVEALSIKEYERLAKDLRKLGMVQIDFTGGEPTIYPYLEKIIALFNPDSTYISISTNAIGPLSEGQLLRYRKIGVDSLMISVDSMNPEEHDRFRQKKGALKEALETIGLCKKLGLSVFVCVVIHHQNLYSKGLEDLLKFTKENALIINFVLAVPAGVWSDFEFFKKEFMLTKEDKFYVRDLIKKNHHARFDFGINLKRWGCPAAAEKIYVTPYGEVAPCPFIQISFGNIRDRGVIEIRKKMLNERRISQYFNQCLAAEDKMFIDNYLLKTFSEKELPVSSDQIFH